MPRVLLDLGDHFLHFGQNGRRDFVVDIALQELQNIEAVALVRNEVGEQDVQPVVDVDEVVPVLGAAADGVSKF